MANSITLDDYQARAHETAVFHPEHGIAYCAMKLVGEAGEVVEKVAKLTRDDGLRFDQLHTMPSAKREALAKELGDVLWYVSELSLCLGYSLSEIADINRAKLAARKEAGTLKGSGDDR